MSDPLWYVDVDAWGHNGEFRIGGKWYKMKRQIGERRWVAEEINGPECPTWCDGNHEIGPYWRKIMKELGKGEA